MKILTKTLVVLSLLTLSPLAHAEAINCKPTDSTRWKEASVTYLGSSAQSLRQVRAAGIYLTADLICSLDRCVGFVGGVEVKGKLELSSADGSPVAISFGTVKRSWIPDGNFSCR